MLGKRGIYALRALLELGLDPRRWRSGPDLALAQGLPAPMLEQLLLKLRRADLVEARRGRQGGYRLARPAAAIPLAAILAAVDSPAAPPRQQDAAQAADPGDQVTGELQRRLRQALQQELERLTLEELLYDLHSSRAALSEEGGLLLG
jgi:Rrf2 family transcriptional regulator, iron-sulfur cluster assembly transcription factor